MNGAVFVPKYDLGLFRYTAARYVKLLIRARWKSNPGFLAQNELARWELVDIANDPHPAWRSPHYLRVGHDGRDPCDRPGWHRHSDGGHCGHRQWQQHSKEGLERHEISCWTLLCAWPAGQGLLPVPAPCPAGPHAGPRSLIGMAQDLLTFGGSRRRMLTSDSL